MRDKGISPILSTVLIVLVVIALAGTFLAFSGRSITQVTETGTEQQQEFAEETQEGISILALSCASGGDEMTIRNSGSTTYSTSDLTVFVDDSTTTTGSWSPSGDLSPDDTSTLDGGSDFVDDGQTIRVTTPQGASDSTVCSV